MQKNKILLAGLILLAAAPLSYVGATVYNDHKKLTSIHETQETMRIAANGLVKVVHEIKNNGEIGAADIGAGQRVEIPNDGDAYAATLVVSPNWQSKPADNRLVLTFQTDERLRSVTSRINVYTTDDPIFKSFRADVGDQTPAVLLQRPGAPYGDGAIVYRANRSLPNLTSTQLISQLQQAKANDGKTFRPFKPCPEPKPAPTPPTPAPVVTPPPEVGPATPVDEFPPAVVFVCMAATGVIVLVVGFVRRTQ